MPNNDSSIRLANTAKANLTATTAPTVNDDSTQGYAVGSLWIDTTNYRIYQCVNATPGAAVWEGTHPEFVQGGEVAGPVTTTSNTFVLAGTITKTTEASYFKLNACCEMLGAGMSSGFTENQCLVEVRVDGTPVIPFAELCTFYAAHSGIALVNLSAGSHSITFWIRRSNAGTVGIRNMRACLSKVVVS